MKICPLMLVIALVFTMPTVSVLAADLDYAAQKDLDTRVSDAVRVSRIRADDVTPDRFRYEFTGGRLDTPCGAESGPWADSSDKNINDVLKMAYTLNQKIIISTFGDCKIRMVITTK